MSNRSLTTSWKIWDKENEEWKHNHISYGHVETEKPNDLHSDHDTYVKNNNWKKIYGYLDGKRRFIKTG